MDGDHKTLTLVSGNKLLSGSEEGDGDGNDTKQHCKSLPLYYDMVSDFKLSLSRRVFYFVVLFFN